MNAPWWDYHYLYRKPLTITTVAALPANYPISLIEDTAALEAAGKLRSDRNDLRIVRFSGGVWTDLSRDYIATNKTFWGLASSIGASSTNTEYYLYYGYAAEATSKQPSSESDWNSVYFGLSDGNAVALYHFREGTGTSLNDDSPNSNTGTAENSPAWGTDGRFGRYLDFSGVSGASSQRINLGDIDLTSSFTIEGFFYFDTVSRINPLLTKALEGLGSTTINFEVTGLNAINIATNDNSGGTTAVSGGSIAASTWYHIAATKSGATGKLFLDGTEIASGTLETPLNTTQPMYLAVRKESPFLESMDGRMQHVRLSNIARASFPYGFASSSDPTITINTEQRPAGGGFLNFLI